MEKAGGKASVVGPFAFLNFSPQNTWAPRSVRQHAPCTFLGKAAFGMEARESLHQEFMSVGEPACRNGLRLSKMNFRAEVATWLSLAVVRPRRESEEQAGR